MSARWGPGYHPERRRGERRQPFVDPLYVPGDEPRPEPLPPFLPKPPYNPPEPSLPDRETAEEYRSGAVFVWLVVAVLWLVAGALVVRWVLVAP